MAVCAWGGPSEWHVSLLEPRAFASSPAGLTARKCIGSRSTSLGRESFSRLRLLQRRETSGRLSGPSRQTSLSDASLSVGDVVYGVTRQRTRVSRKTVSEARVNTECSCSRATLFALRWSPNFLVSKSSQEYCVQARCQCLVSLLAVDHWTFKSEICSSHQRVLCATLAEEFPKNESQGLCSPRQFQPPPQRLPPAVRLLHRLGPNGPNSARQARQGRVNTPVQARQALTRGLSKWDGMRNRNRVGEWRWICARMTRRDPTRSTMVSAQPRGRRSPPDPTSWASAQHHRSFH